MNRSIDSHWTRTWVKLGALCWVVLAALCFSGKAPIGIIDLLFLLAPLVVVPLGFELLDGFAQGMRPVGLGRAVRVMQPVAALMAVASFWFPVGRVAGALASGWLAVGALVAGMAAADVYRGGWRSLNRMVFNVARLDLLFASCWFLVSRFGVTPMGFQEPIVLLTGVHFHYSGFATALLAGVTLQASRGRERPGSAVVKLIVASAALLPFLLAAGFVFSATLKLLCALILGVTLMGFLALQFSEAGSFRGGIARTLLLAAAGLLVPGMLLVIAYAIGEYTGADWLVIPQMARIHGALNGPGFVLLSLLAWVTESSYRAQRFQELEHEIDRKSVPISALRRLSS